MVGKLGSGLSVVLFSVLLICCAAKRSEVEARASISCITNVTLLNDTNTVHVHTKL